MPDELTPAQRQEIFKILLAELRQSHEQARDKCAEVDLAEQVEQRRQRLQPSPPASEEEEP